MRRRLPVLSMLLTILALSLPAGAVSPESREYKILLKPERFADPAAGMKAYWDQLRIIARDLQIKIREVSDPVLKDPRYIQFLDTADHGLRKAGYILRRRQKTPFSPTGVEAAPDSEFTFKFRHASCKVAAGKPVAAAAAFPGSLKFEEDISVGLAGERRVYARSGRVELKENLTGTLADYARVFPGLRQTGVCHDLPLAAVRQIRIRELRLKPGKIDFGKIEAEVTLSVWYREGQNAPLVAEFSFQCENPRDPGSLKAFRSAQQMEKLVEALRVRTRDWIYPGKTKTDLVYGD